MSQKFNVLSEIPAEGELQFRVNNDDEKNQIEALLPADWKAEVEFIDSMLKIRFSCPVQDLQRRTNSFLETLKNHNIPKPLPIARGNDSDDDDDDSDDSDIE